MSARLREYSPSKGLAISCRHVALFAHPVIPACVGDCKRRRPRPLRRVYCLEFSLLEMRMKLKAKSDLLERARTAWEAVARQVGETDFFAPSTHRRVFCIPVSPWVGGSTKRICSFTCSQDSPREGLDVDSR